MAQHFLLSTEARDLSLMKFFNMNEDEAFEVFKVVRWRIQTVSLYALVVEIQMSIIL